MESWFHIRLTRMTKHVKCTCPPDRNSVTANIFQQVPSGKIKSGINIHTLQLHQSSYNIFTGGLNELGESIQDNVIMFQTEATTHSKLYRQDTEGKRQIKFR